MTPAASSFRVPRKYVLVLDRPDGTLSDMAAGLKRLGFDAVRVHSCASAMHHVATSPLLSMVAVFVDERSDRETAAALVTELRRRGVGVPVVWATTAAVADETEQDVPEGCVRISLSSELASAEFERTIGPLLREGLYAPWLVETLARASAETLRDGFATPASVDEPFLKATSVSIGDVRASIGFGSRYVRGYILVGGDREAFEQMWRRLFDVTSAVSIDSLADLAGEVCNHILGRMAPRLGTKVDPIRPSMPMLVIGPELVLRAKSPKPTLIFPLQCDNQMLYVSLCVEHCDLDGPAEADDNLMAGEMVFL